MIAHLYDNRILCTACVRTVHTTEHATLLRDSDLVEDDEPATDSQMRFCDELGIPVPAGAGKWQVSRMIDQKLNELHENEAELAIRLEPHLRRAGLLPTEDGECARRLAEKDRIIQALVSQLDARPHVDRPRIGT